MHSLFRRMRTRRFSPAVNGGKALCRLRTVIRRKFEMTPRWNAQHPNGKQGFQPSRQDNRCLNTPGIHHSSPPHGRQRLHTDGDNAEQPQNGRLAFRGARSCTADEEVTKREEVAKPAKKKQRACTSTTGTTPATHSAHPIHRVPEESLPPPCRFCVQTAEQRGCSPWPRLRPHSE